MKKLSTKKSILIISSCVIIIGTLFFLNKDKNTNFNSTGNMISKANENRLTGKPIPAKLRWE